jgi:SAM-dependent methyltransferase
MKCRLCNAELEHVFVDLGSSPAANSFLTKAQLNEPEVWYPMKLYVCTTCWLVQMDEYKLATEIFNEDYPYYSSHSPGNVSRAKEYAEMMINRFGFTTENRILEVGGNDGYLLQHFPEGSRVLNIDPSTGAAQESRRKGIPTFSGFFSRDFVLSAQHKGSFDLICGSNVLAHNPNLNDFVEGLRIALKPDGVITMEFPHLLNLLNGTCQFDTIYHEHYSYLSFMTVCELFKRHGLEVFDVTMTPEQGGSIMIFAQHEGGRQPAFAGVTKLLVLENGMGMYGLPCYRDFQRRVERTKRDLLIFLLYRKSIGETVVAYGASCKCNTLLNYCGIRPDLIKFVVDKSPLKQGKYLPGSHLPILTEDELKKERPEFVIITAWNLKDEIMDQLSYIRGWGGKFVMTTPYLEVL